MYVGTQIYERIVLKDFQLKHLLVDFYNMKSWKHCYLFTNPEGWTNSEISSIFTIKIVLCTYIVGEILPKNFQNLFF